MKKKKNIRFKRIWWPWVNRKYKDTVFRLLFKNDKEALLELYNAVNHANYENPDDLIINTLDNAIYLGMRNDLSFILDTHLNIYEHQSTKGTNIPLRCLFYVSSLYSLLVDDDKIYGDKKLTIPEPHFVVFYNGTDSMPEESVYKLSDMYDNCSEAPALELNIKVLNINHGMNSSLMESCKKLNEYSIFVAKIREYSETLPLNKAVSRAIDYCIANDILKDFLMQERKAVTMYSLYEYNQAGHMKVIKEESFSDGEEHERARVIASMLSKGKTAEEISDLCGYSIEEISSVADKKN